MEKSLVTFSFDTLSKIARKTRFCRTYTYWEYKKDISTKKSDFIGLFSCPKGGKFFYQIIDIF